MAVVSSTPRYTHVYITIIACLILLLSSSYSVYAASEYRWLPKEGVPELKCQQEGNDTDYICQQRTSSTAPWTDYQGFYCSIYGTKGACEYYNYGPSSAVPPTERATINYCTTVLKYNDKDVCFIAPGKNKWCISPNAPADEKPVICPSSSSSSISGDLHPTCNTSVCDDQQPTNLCTSRFNSIYSTNKPCPVYTTPDVSHVALDFCDPATLQPWADMVSSPQIKVGTTWRQVDATVPPMVDPVCPDIQCKTSDMDTYMACGDVVADLPCPASGKMPLTSIKCTLYGDVIYTSDENPEEFAKYCEKFTPQYTTCIPPQWKCSLFDDASKSTPEMCTNTVAFDAQPCIEVDPISSTMDILQDDVTYDGIKTRYVYCYVKGVYSTDTTECMQIDKPAETKGCLLSERIFITNIETKGASYTVYKDGTFTIAVDSVYLHVLDKYVISFRPQESQGQAAALLPIYTIDATEYLKTMLDKDATMTKFTISYTNGATARFEMNSIVYGNGNDDVSIQSNGEEVMISLDDQGRAAKHLYAGKYDVLVIVTPHPRAHGEDHDHDDDAYTIQHHETEDPRQYTAKNVLTISNECMSAYCNGFGCGVNHKCACPSWSLNESCTDATCSYEQKQSCGINSDQCVMDPPDEESRTPSLPRCVCKTGWSGEKCNMQCDLECGVHGSCVPATTRPAAPERCACFDGYSGDDCSVPPTIQCELDCGEYGVCVPPQNTTGKETCACSSGYSGERCQIAPQNACLYYDRCSAHPFAECRLEPETRAPSCHCSAAPLEQCENKSTPIYPAKADTTGSSICGCTCHVLDAARWNISTHDGPQCTCPVLHTTLLVYGTLDLGKTEVDEWIDNMIGAFSYLTSIPSSLITISPSAEQLVDYNPSKHPYSGLILSQNISLDRDSNKPYMITFHIKACKNIEAMMMVADDTKDNTTDNQDEGEDAEIDRDQVIQILAGLKNNPNSVELRAFLDSDPMRLIQTDTIQTSTFAAPYDPTCTGTTCPDKFAPEEAKKEDDAIIPDDSDDDDNNNNDDDDNNNDDKTDKGFKTSTIILGIIVGVLLIAVVVLGVFCILKRNNNKAFPPHHDVDSSPQVLSL